VFDVFQMLAEVEPEVLERFGLDTVAVQRPKVAFGIANRDWKPCTLPQGICAMGVDALKPVQTSATGMYPTVLKRDLGERMVFWGGSCDAQSMLDRGSPKEVAAEVKANLNALRPLEGGHEFASIHNIQATVPPESIVALFETALSYQG